MSDSATLDYQAPDPPSGPVEPSEPLWLGLPVSAWVKIATVTMLMIALFWPNLRRLWEKTNPFTGEANWGHAICIPFVALYYLYVNREELLKSAAVSKGSWAGLAIMILGILVFGYGIWPGQNDFIKDFGMVVTLFGVVLLLSGWRVMKIAWFPIAFLVCGIPWPGLVYSWVATPLQQLAANVAVGVLSATGVTSFASGTKIIMHGYGGAVRTLNVAEACAGLRSLMTFISVGASIAFLSSRPLWQKIGITVSAIPIAIFCNVMRVSGQGLLDHYVSQELSESFAHQFVGMVMLIPAFFMILGVGWVLDQVFVDEVDESEALERQLLVRRAQPAIVAPVPPPGSSLASQRTPGASVRKPPAAGAADGNGAGSIGAANGAATNPASVNGAAANGASANGAAANGATGGAGVGGARAGGAGGVKAGGAGAVGVGGVARPVPVPPPPNSVMARRRASTKPSGAAGIDRAKPGPARTRAGEGIADGKGSSSQADLKPETR
jgi:exosortase